MNINFSSAVSWLKSQEVLRVINRCPESDFEGSKLRIWNREFGVNEANHMYDEVNEANHIYDEECV